MTSIDELMNTALLCSAGRIPGRGGIGLVTDSGGLRELQVDLASERGAPLARLTPQTLEKLRAALPPELEPSNPLDCAADMTDEFPRVFDRGLTILAEAREISMLGFEADLRDDFVYNDALLDHAKSLAGRTEKPCFVYTSFAQANNRRLADELADAAVPYINGAGNMLAAATHLQTWADRRNDPEDGQLTGLPTALTQDQTSLLATRPDEHASLMLLESFGVPVTGSRVCNSLDEVLTAAGTIGFPIALKTAEKGIEHKSDQHGVILDIASIEALESAHADLVHRLGPRVTVQAMAKRGIELAFGCIIDADFGPLVMVSAGGRLVELFNDRRFARAPFTAQTAETLIRRLPAARLIDGVRGDPPRDMAAAAAALSRFSIACKVLAPYIAEIDVNPVIVTENGAQAVDALIIQAR